MSFLFVKRVRKMIFIFTVSGAVDVAIEEAESRMEPHSACAMLHDFEKQVTADMLQEGEDRHSDIRPGPK